MASHADGRLVHRFESRYTYRGHERVGSATKTNPNSRTVRFSFRPSAIGSPSSSYRWVTRLEGPGGNALDRVPNRVVLGAYLIPAKLSRGEPQGYPWRRALVHAGPTDDEAGLPIRPRPDGSDIRKAEPSERAAVVEALARGFHDDPQLCWVIPNEDRRAHELDLGFDFFARWIYFQQGEVYTTDGVGGAACWLPPGKTRVSAFRQLLMLPGMVSIFRADVRRLLALLSTFEKKHPHAPEHWYLPAIALRPEWQGRGFGAALLAPVLDRCDREGIPAYLEATSPRNRSLYERHGFAVREEIRAHKDAPPAWAMWREPQEPRHPMD